MFKKKIETATFSYDPDKHVPVLKCSICNGEQVAGFKDKAGGKFHEVMLIKSAEELDDFMEKYKIEVITKEY